MKFVFWQNSISIHQIPFLRELAKEHSVTLVTECGISTERTKEGWSNPDIGNLYVAVAPNDNVIKSLIAKNDQHVFSGINAFPLVYKAFKFAIKSNKSISVLSEPYNIRGFKGKLRYIKYVILGLRYGKHINRIFTTGIEGEWVYRIAGWPVDKICQWGYFTDNICDTTQDKTNHTRPNLIFIGKICRRKNIIPFLRVAIKYHDLYNELRIIGDGPLKHELMTTISKVKNIHYQGVVSNKEVNYYLQKADLLILPSLYDGWGAVVNESLSTGTRVFCSDNCGASILIDKNGYRGTVFPLKKMEESLRQELSRPALSDTHRKNIIEWSKSHISGIIASAYFINCIKSRTKPIAPWIEK